MSTLYGFALLVLVVFVAIAPRRVLGPVFGLLGRVLGTGVVALVCLGAAIYIFSNEASAPYRPHGFAALGVGVVCAAWWIYRRFRPVYREQAPDPVSDLADS
jgi:hypothetical protein